MTKNEKVQRVKRYILNWKFITDLFFVLMYNIHITSSIYIYYNSLIFTEIKMLFDAKIIFTRRKNNHKTFKKEKLRNCWALYICFKYWVSVKKKSEGAADIKAALWCSDKAFELLEMKYILNIKQRISRRKNFDKVTRNIPIISQWLFGLHYDFRRFYVFQNSNWFLTGERGKRREREGGRMDIFYFLSITRAGLRTNYQLQKLWH